MARPDKYLTHVKPNLDLIQSWREKGMSEEDIAVYKLKIAYSTLREHKKKYPALKAVLDTSREILGAKIKKGLWKEAIGYEYEEIQEHIESIIDKKGNITDKKKVKRVKIKKYARPSPQLVVFALCNLLPKEFTRVDKEAIKDLEESNKKALKDIFSSDKVNDMLGILYNNAYSESIKNKNDLEKEKGAK